MLVSTPVVLSPLVLSAQLVFALATPPAPGTREVLYLVTPQPTGIDAPALADAVGIYTRDLQLAVRVVSGESPPSTPAAAPSVAALVHAHGARLAFWCVPADDARSVTLFSVDDAGTWREERVPFNGTVRADFHRAVALKLRAILTSSPRGERAEAPPRAAPADAGLASSPGVATGPPFAPAEPGPVKDAGPRWALGLQYGLALSPAQSTTPRQFAGFEIAAGPGSSSLHGLELFLGGRLASAEPATVATGTISLVEVPLRLGARWVGRGRRIAGALGVFATVDLISASASSTVGAKSDTLTASGGGGVQALARVPASGRWCLELTAWAEVISPRTRFFVGDTPAIETGRYRVGLALGPALSTR